MDIYYIKDRLICTEEEKIECMEMVKKVRCLWKIGRRDGLPAFCDELQESSYFNKMPLFQVALPLFDSGLEEEIIRKVLENYIVLSDMRGKNLLKALIVLEGFGGVVGERSMKVLMETMCSYFGLEFREKFYYFIRPTFLDENCF